MNKKHTLIPILFFGLILSFIPLTLGINCVDNDGGSDYIKKSSVYTYEPKIITPGVPSAAGVTALEESMDECLSDGITLKEYVCVDNKIESVSYVCSKKCDDGKCVDEFDMEAVENPNPGNDGGGGGGIPAVFPEDSEPQVCENYVICDNGKKIQTCQFISLESGQGGGCACKTKESACKELDNKESCEEYHICPDGNKIKICDYVSPVGGQGGGCLCKDIEPVCEDEEKVIPASCSSKEGITTCSSGYGEVIKIKTGLKLEQETEENSENVGSGSASGISSNKETKSKTMFKAKLSDGKTISIKVMPEEVKIKFKEKFNIKEENQTINIELKEEYVKVKGFDEIIAEAKYHVSTEKQGRILGIFKTKAIIKAEINPESGEIIDFNKPWWAFLAYGI